MNVKFPYKLIDDLLATLSPEEESQKIMMKQVPKEKRLNSEYHDQAIDECLNTKSSKEKECCYCQVGKPQKVVKAVVTSACTGKPKKTRLCYLE